MIEVSVFRESVSAGDDSRYGSRSLSLHEREFVKKVILKSCCIDNGEYGYIFKNYGDAWSLYIDNKLVAKFNFKNGELRLLEELMTTIKDLKITTNTELVFRRADI